MSRVRPAAALLVALAALAPGASAQTDARDAGAADRAIVLELVRAAPDCAVAPFDLTDQAFAAGLTPERLVAARAELMVAGEIAFDTERRVVTLVDASACD